MGEASRMTFPLPVILRSGSDEGSFSVGPVGDGRRSFAALRMTMGRTLRITGAGARDDSGRECLGERRREYPG